MMSYKFDDIIQKQKIILSKTVKKNCAIPNNMTHGIKSIPNLPWFVTELHQDIEV
jgi:hypothetical protein